MIMIIPRRYMFPLLLILVLVRAGHGQDPHTLIRTMERERMARHSELFTEVRERVPHAGYDVTWYRLELDIDPVTQILTGAVTMQARARSAALTTVVLDLLDNMLVDSVYGGGSLLGFTHQNNLLTVTLPGTAGSGELLAVTVSYHGHPTATGGFAAFDFGTHAGHPIISTLSEPFGSRSWWPCNDDPADKADSVDIIVTVPGDLVVASNGVLRTVTDHGDGTKTYHWAERYPISTYLVSLAITNYAVFSDYYRYGPADSMEVRFYVYPEHLAAAQEDFSVTTDMLAAFSAVFGPYPFLAEKYGIAEFPWGGAMEHQTCTSYGDHLITGNHAYDRVNAHELAHQWYGDLVTMRYWAHIWLNEGFASYGEALWAESQGGLPAYLDAMRGMDVSGYFPTSVFVYDSTNINALFSGTVYDKGAWVLHMLRHVLGDSLFFAALRDYTLSHAYANATTADFQAVCESHYGQDLGWFFQQWVYGIYRPRYTYQWSDSSLGGQHQVTLTLNQVQTNTGLFKMPLDVVLLTAAGDPTVVVWDSLASQTFQWFLDEPVLGVELDPAGWVLKRVLTPQTYLVQGQVTEMDGSTALEDVWVYAARVNNQGGVLGLDSIRTESGGNFSLSLRPGFYGITPVKAGWLSPPVTYLEVQRPLAGLALTMSAPELEMSRDSVGVFLDSSVTFVDTLWIRNNGTGRLLFSLCTRPQVSGSGSFHAGGPANLVSPELHLEPGDWPAAIPAVNPPPPPVDSLWQLVFQDPADNGSGPADIQALWMQAGEETLFLRTTFHRNYGSLEDFQLRLYLDTDNDVATGLPLGWLGADRMLFISDYGGVRAALLRFSGSQFVFEALAEYARVESDTNAFEAGFPIGHLEAPGMLRMAAVAWYPSDPFSGSDYAPEQNSGYLVFSVDPVPWVRCEPYFGVLNAAGQTAVLVELHPEHLPPGHHRATLVLGHNTPGAVPVVLPVVLNYRNLSLAGEAALPEALILDQNYPNPWNPLTAIRFGIPRRSRVTLTVYDLLGRTVRVLTNETRAAGFYTVRWDGTGKNGEPVGAGVYIFRIQAEGQTRSQKMVLLK